MQCTYEDSTPLNAANVDETQQKSAALQIIPSVWLTMIRKGGVEETKLVYTGGTTIQAALQPTSASPSIFDPTTHENDKRVQNDHGKMPYHISRKEELLHTLVHA